MLWIWKARSCWHTTPLSEEKGELKDFLKGNELRGNTQYITCKQKQLVAGAGTRPCGVGRKTENRDNSRKPEHSLQHKKAGGRGGGPTYIKYLYGFAFWECETKGNALMLSFLDH